MCKIMSQGRHPATFFLELKYNEALTYTHDKTNKIWRHNKNYNIRIWSSSYIQLVYKYININIKYKNVRLIWNVPSMLEKNGLIVQCKYNYILDYLGKIYQTSAKYEKNISVSVKALS